MLRALKALQEKIRGLELDRITAAEKFQHLSEETQDHAQFSEGSDHARSSHSSSPSPPAYPILSQSDTHGNVYYLPTLTLSISACSILLCLLCVVLHLVYYLYVDLRRQLSKIDAKFSDQAHELQKMKERLQLAEATREQGMACSQLLEQQHKEPLRQQRKILQHVAKVKAKLTCTCTSVGTTNDVMFKTVVYTTNCQLSM